MQEQGGVVMMVVGKGEDSLAKSARAKVSVWRSRLADCVREVRASPAPKGSL